MAFADFIASAGLQGGALKSENTSNGDPLLKGSQFGFKGEIEFGYSYLTLFGSVDAATGSGKSQYNYTNPDNASDQATVNDLKTRMNLYRLSLGSRLKLIKLKKIRLFAGGGYQFGFLTLTHDENDFKNNTNSTTGFEEIERRNLNGGFAELGMEIIFTANSGLRLSAQRSFIKSDKFETLGDKELKFNYTSFALTYIEYVETGSW